MGIFGALTTAVSGLRAQSYALENISGNIANSQTPGFKRVETSFVDMIPELPYRHEVAGSVSAFSRLTNTIKGDPNSTGVATNVAISGEGFFMVQNRVGYSNNQPIFGGTDLFTRRGDFQLDKDGYLVNGAGFYLRGTTIDPVTGQVKGNGSSVIKISSDPVSSKKTTSILYKANLPTRPATEDAVLDNPDSVLYQEARDTDGDGTTDTTVPASAVTTSRAPSDPPIGVAGADEASFLRQSVSGGAVTVYNDVGTPIDVQLRWAKISSSPDETWNLFYQSKANAGPAEMAWTNVGAAIKFDSKGAMIPPTSVDIPNLNVDDTTVAGLKLDFGERGLTQYSTASGLVQASTIEQDGYPSGSLSSVQVMGDGRIVGNYTNGRTVPVAEIPIVQFNADNALKRLDSGVYERTLESGLPIVGLNGSSLIGGYIEGSNTDIAEEFSKMIVTQQAYSANTRVVSTSQQMMTEVINMVR
jgi:flagellar hook protein FlgE